MFKLQGVETGGEILEKVKNVYQTHTGKDSISFKLEEIRI